MRDGAKRVPKEGPKEGSAAHHDPSPADQAMNRYADGDRVAFAEVYDGVAPCLLRWLERRTGDCALAQDVLQSTLLCMHDARGRFIRGARVLPWAYTIARRLLIDMLRRRHGESRYFEAMPEECIEPEAEGLAEAAETARCMAAAFEVLPERSREAFSLMRGEGLSLKETAEVMGTTVTAVKLRVHRVSHALHAAMSAMGVRGA
jgi:RNA polymerase sigma-70 factor (ECF subfamily)